MESRTKILGHPVHPQLIVFPLGLLATSVALDIIWLSSDDPRYASASFIIIAAGLLTGLIAAVAGYLDWRWIPANTRASRIGLIHGAGNLIVVALFAASWAVRYPAPALPPVSAYVLSWAGAALALLTGWLGGELVYRLGVAVDNGAHINSPSSLRGEPALAGRTEQPAEHYQQPPPRRAGNL